MQQININEMLCTLSILLDSYRVLYQQWTCIQDQKDRKGYKSEFSTQHILKFDRPTLKFNIEYSTEIIKMTHTNVRYHTLGIDQRFSESNNIHDAIKCEAKISYTIAENRISRTNSTDKLPLV